MGTNLAELILLAAAAAGLYVLLRPVQAWLERWILKFLDPKERSLIDAEIVADQNRKKRKE